MIPAKGDPENSGNVSAAVELRYVDQEDDVWTCYPPVSYTHLTLPTSDLV